MPYILSDEDSIIVVHLLVEYARIHRELTPPMVSLLANLERSARHAQHISTALIAAAPVLNNIRVSEAPTTNGIGPSPHAQSFYTSSDSLTPTPPPSTVPKLDGATDSRILSRSPSLPPAHLSVSARPAAAALLLTPPRPLPDHLPGAPSGGGSGAGARRPLSPLPTHDLLHAQTSSRPRKRARARAPSVKPVDVSPDIVRLLCQAARSVGSDLDAALADRGAPALPASLAALLAPEGPAAVHSDGLLVVPDHTSIMRQLRIGTIGSTFVDAMNRMQLLACLPRLEPWEAEECRTLSNGAEQCAIMAEGGTPYVLLLAASRDLLRCFMKTELRDITSVASLMRNPDDSPLGISIAKDLIPTICKLRRAVAFEFSTLLPVDQLKVLGLRPTVSSVDTTQCDSYFGFIHKERADYQELPKRAHVWSINCETHPELKPDVNRPGSEILG